MTPLGMYSIKFPEQGCILRAKQGETGRAKYDRTREMGTEQGGA